MTQYTDLNKIVQDYTISKNGGTQELQELQKRLSDVPVSLVQFEKYLKELKSGFSELSILAEFFDPQMRVFMLDNLVEQDKAYRLIERMVLPYPIIVMSGDAISKTFYNKTKRRLGKLILPDKRDETARVFSRSDCSGVAVVYERKNKVHYLEMVLVNSYPSIR